VPRRRGPRDPARIAAARFPRCSTRIGPAQQPGRADHAIRAVVLVTYDFLERGGVASGTEPLDTRRTSLATLRHTRAHRSGGRAAAVGRNSPRRRGRQLARLR
jgi:hypothetical protein